ncbi:MAG: acetate--CoA ligase family protein [Nanoarchaeota archaeon]|nr:acetate--CoA ligase family protein [Nanoarchaeota archaeon]
MRVVGEREAEQFLEKQGFPVSSRMVSSSFFVCKDFAHKVGYPVAAKVVSDKIVHKSDVGGVILNIHSDVELKVAFDKLMKIRTAQGVMVEPFSAGVCLLLGLKYDVTFGHTLVVGWGDIYTEVLKDVALRLCPVDEKVALQMLEELKVFKLLQGVRGSVKADLKKIVKVMVKLSELPKKFPQIRELDINPLLVHGSSLRIVDARMVVNE